MTAMDYRQQMNALDEEMVRLRIEERTERMRLDDERQLQSRLLTEQYAEARRKLLRDCREQLDKTHETFVVRRREVFLRMETLKARFKKEGGEE